MVENPDWPSGYAPYLMLCKGCEKCMRPEDRY